LRPVASTRRKRWAGFLTVLVAATAFLAVAAGHETAEARGLKLPGFTQGFGKGLGKSLGKGIGKNLLTKEEQQPPAEEQPAEQDEAPESTDEEAPASTPRYQPPVQQNPVPQNSSQYYGYHPLQQPTGDGTVLYDVPSQQ